MSNPHSLEITFNPQSYFLGIEESVISRLICPLSENCPLVQVNYSMYSLTAGFFLLLHPVQILIIFLIFKICEDFVIFLNKRNRTL